MPVPYGCATGAPRVSAAAKLICKLSGEARSGQEEDICKKALREARAHAKGSHAPAHFRDSVRARPRRLLSGRAKRQVGFKHHRRHAEVSVVQGPGAFGEARRAQPSEAGPRLQCRRRLRAQASNSARTGQPGCACGKSSRSFVATAFAWPERGWRKHPIRLERFSAQAPSVLILYASMPRRPSGTLAPHHRSCYSESAILPRHLIEAPNQIQRLTRSHLWRNAHGNGSDAQGFQELHQW
jgi:hypothetical protein